MKKTIVTADPFPFRVGKVRLAYPGILNGETTVHEPREEFSVVVWEKTARPTSPMRFQKRT